MSRHPNYRKPPRETQFKPGQSGNPGGRPKREPTVRDALQKALQREVPAVLDGRRQMLPAMDVLANALVAHLSKKPIDLVQVARWLEGERPVHGPGEPQDLAMDEAPLRDLIRRARRGEDTPERGSDDDEA